MSADPFTIRCAGDADLPRMQEIFAIARAFMRSTGNPTQWGQTRPPAATIQNDIAEGRSRLIECDGRIVGTFAFIIWEDPMYASIEDGSWPNEEPYAVIHRVASDGTVKGVFPAALSYAEEQAKASGLRNLRIDTHNDNKVMQHVVTKNGFVRCGIVYADDGTPRIAFQKILG